MTRMAGALAGALVLAAPAAPAAAQRGIEVGAFARYADFDNSLGMGTTVAAGGRAAFYLGPALALELDVARGSAGSVTHTPVHLRVLRDAAVIGRVATVIGAGYVRNWYGAPYDASDGGISVLLGLAYRATERLSVRLAADLDAMFHTSDRSPFPFYNGNWGLQLGAGARLKH